MAQHGWRQDDCCALDGSVIKIDLAPMSVLRFDVKPSSRSVAQEEQMPLAVGPTMAMTEDQVMGYRRDGFVVVRGLFDDDEATGIGDAFMAQAAHGPVPGLSDMGYGFQNGDPLARYPRMMHPHRHPELEVGSLSMRVLLAPRIETVLQALFGEAPVAAQSMFYFKPPGSRGQDLHQDNFYLRVKPGTCIAAWMAVDSADRENGGLVVVPGTGGLDVACPGPSDSRLFFTRDHVDVPEGLQEQPVDLAPGDVLFFNGNVIHGSYPNQSQDRFRRAFICHYVPESSAEVAHWYRPLLRFDGSEVHINEATGGGPCGEGVDTVKGPH